MKERLAKLAVLIGTNQSTGGNVPNDCVQTKVRRTDEIGIQRHFYRVVPLLTEPATDPFTVHWGGGRIHGGGYSKDAQRRAEKQKKTAKSNRRDNS